MGIQVTAGRSRLRTQTEVILSRLAVRKKIKTAQDKFYSAKAKAEREPLDVCFITFPILFFLRHFLNIFNPQISYATLVHFETTVT